MDFVDIAAHFAHAPSGTDSFKSFYKSAFDLMKSDRENAGLYFVVGIAAQSFVRSYEDQGITAEFADQAQATLVAMNAQLVTALQSEPAERLRLLGDVAFDYEWNVTAF